MGFELTPRKCMEKKTVTNQWKLNTLQTKVSYYGCNTIMAKQLLILTLYYMPLVLMTFNTRYN